MLIRLTPLLLILFLSSCASPHHAVNSTRINESKDKVFRIGTIKVSCKLQCLPARAPYKAKQQLATVRNTNPQEVLKILSESYGLKTAESINLEEKSYPIHFTGFISEDMGRCYYMENTADAGNDNIVDISYDISARCLPLQPLNATFSYKIIVKSKGEVLIEHQDEVDTINFGYKWLDSGDIDQIINTAKKIPTVLKRDISKTKK